MDPRLYRQLHEMERNHWWFAGRRRVLLAALERMRVEAESILDVGCGAGTNLDLLAERYANREVHGIDIEIEPLRFCRSDRSVPVSQADLARLPFCDGAFDLVCALDSIEHVADDGAALRGLHRVCRPGGTLLATVPAFPFLWGNVDVVGHHYRRYTRVELIEKISAAGFEVRFARYFNYLLFPPIALVRLLARLKPERAAETADDVHTDFDLVKSGPVNTLLQHIFGLEASLLGLDVPFGVSLLCVAERPATG
jgi:SAM-dependent methyltransferase